ncbi:MAG: AAA family ATPase [Candidatus Aenigmarchaeota archaeon]|nr:AAA family ATPase [Candidatus Aenigmarchaeota archaeon]
MGDIERIKTGIPGLDKLIDGGFVKGSSILVSGSAGTGKTIFCCQFLWEGLKNGENCMYITFEELPEEIKADAAVFGWDFEKYEKSGKLIISYRDPFQTTDVTTRLENEIKQSKVTRVVIDSTSLLGMYFKDAHDIRRELYKLVKALKTSGATSVLTAEIPQEDGKISRFGVEEYVVDGVIVLNFILMGPESGRSLVIRKMRRTKHNEEIHPIKIDKNGLRVLSINL